MGIDPYIVDTKQSSMSVAAIQFFKENIRFRFLNREEITSWISAAIRKEGFKVGAVNVIFCSDKHLRKMNKQYLQHDYNTDIITFDLTDDPAVIHGELFISIDRVKQNAATYETGFTDELHRVIIHGVLHLCGYSDKSTLKVKEMRTREDFYLKKRSWLK